jgi:hypothetical protein
VVQSKLMELPNNVWKSAMQQAAVNVQVRPLHGALPSTTSASHAEFDLVCLHVMPGSL